MFYITYKKIVKNLVDSINIVYYNLYKWRIFMSERKLATIQEIEKIDPIQGKDVIGLATMKGLGWHVIVNKNDIKVGDKVVYFEVDSQLDSSNPAFEFMSKRKWRVKTMKMGGVFSQGLCIKADELGFSNYKIGEDVTEKLKVTKYDPEAQQERAFARVEKHNKLVTYLLKFSWFRKLYYFGKPGVRTFPTSWISKTDEERIQTKMYVLEKYKGRTLDVSEKIDGQSATYLLKPYKGLFTKWDFQVCSRNLQVDETGSSTYAFVNKKYSMREKCQKLLEVAKKDYPMLKYVGIQGEILAPKVQKNKYKKTEPCFYVFNIILGFDDKKFKCGNDMVVKYCSEIGLDTVPMLPKFVLEGQTVDDMVELSRFKSTMLNIDAEGKVYRVIDGMGFVEDSFKVINPDFLVKNGD